VNAVKIVRMGTFKLRLQISRFRENVGYCFKFYVRRKLL